LRALRTPAGDPVLELGVFGSSAHPLPPPAIYKIPLLKRYTYVKLKHQVLIVNPMNKKIMAVFPED